MFKLMLEAVGGPDLHRRFTYDLSHGRIVHFGPRGDPDLQQQVPSDDSLSGRQFALGTRRDEVLLHHLSATSPTHVNGQPVTGRHPLQSADRIAAGATELLVQGLGVLQPATQRDTPGLRLADLEINARIGGGLSHVHEARVLATGQLVALKRIELRGDAPGPRLRFQREADAVRWLEHPHIVTVLATGESHSEAWIVMEYVQGEAEELDLHQHVGALGPLGVADTVTIGTQLLSALEYAHERGLVHRDVKPANVLLHGRRGAFHCKLADFGLARFAFDETLTSTGQVLGTDPYLAPEQLVDSRHASYRADVYGAAATLYYALTGNNHLEQDPGIVDPFARLKRARFRPLANRRTDLPADLHQLIDRCLALRPADRCASAREMREELQRSIGP